MSASSSPSNFDVGVVIARKKKREQELEKEQRLEADKKEHHTSQPHSSLRDFVYGTSLYIVCLALPTLAGVLSHLFQEEGTVYIKTYYEEFSDYLCHNWWTYWCEEESDPLLSLLHAPDAEWTDVGIVAVLSLSMAVLRLLLVHLLVPRYLAPKRLEALVRCKSVSLLSSAYSKSLTPESSKRTLTVEDFPDPPQELFMEDLTIEKESVWTTMWEAIKSAWTTCCRSVRRVLGVEPRAPYDGDELQDTDRLFTGPRYATAVFRLFYCIGSCTCAIVWLRDANFVPPSVGGFGSTSNCWDLKGGVTLETDSDFDHHNAVLRKYFLVQASYHLHSWATHWLSLLVMAWYGTSLVSIRKSMISYWRALLQHLLALAMIGSCYFFSSLRRLGVIGIFALDLSSLFVHLLQLCINAPNHSWLNNPRVIRYVHRGLVIPIFLYTRFYVFPFVVWHSAIFESRDWLMQMERTLFPGSANVMKMLFHLFGIMNLGLNAIAFRRLLFHPHVQSSFQKRNPPRRPPPRMEPR